MINTSNNLNSLFPVIDKEEDFNLGSVASVTIPINIQNSAILKYSDFTLFKPKDDGVTFGGFYHDQNHEGWLLKTSHYSQPGAIVKEYIAGGLYQLFLGESAPRTEIVVDDIHGSLLIGSKLLDNFSTLSKVADYSTFCNTSFNQPYGNTFPASVNGKPIHGFMEAIWAINFIKDTDAHSGNVGLIDQGSHYDFAKIDHGFSFEYNGNHLSTLDDIRSHLNMFYKIDSLEKIGFDAIYQGITNITKLDFSNIDSLVKEKIDVVKTNMEALKLTELFSDYHFPQNGDLKSNLIQYQDRLLSHLKSEFIQYQKIADFMLLEKSIVEHDAKGLLALLDKGVGLEDQFKPFYDPVFHQDPYYWHVKTQSTTGLELGQKLWPEVFSEANSVALQNHSLTINDIFSAPSTVTATENVMPAIVLVQPMPALEPILI